MIKTNTDPEEINKFGALAAHWWDTTGDFKTLHDINPLRLSFIEQFTSLDNKKVIDIGCGGGILAESMAQKGALVTGIDMGKAVLDVAKLHQLESGLSIEYLHTSAEEIAATRPGSYDVVTCMEMLEHVPNPESIINACAALLKPGGHLFLSTINRNPKAYLYAIVGAEYILKLLPQQTHDYAKFIKPSELAQWARRVNLAIKDVIGIDYNVFSKKFSLKSDISVNYIAHLTFNSY